MDIRIQSSVENRLSVYKCSEFRASALDFFSFVRHSCYLGAYVRSMHRSVIGEDNKNRIVMWQSKRMNIINCEKLHT